MKWFGENIYKRLGIAINGVKMSLLIICLVSLILSMLLAWYTGLFQFGPCVSFFISFCSILGIIFFLLKWNYHSKKSERAPFKSRFAQGFDHIISQGQSVQLLWLAIVFVLLYVVMAGWMGTFNHFNLLPEEVGGLNPLSLTFMLFTDSGTLGDALKNDSHISGLVTLFCLGVSIIGALVFTGLLISVFSNYMQRRVDEYQKGTIRYTLTNHILFLGYDEILPSILCQIISNCTDDVQCVIMTDCDADTVRSRIKHVITDNKIFDNILFYYGERNSEKDILQLNIDKAKDIYIIGDHTENNHDEINIQSLNIITKVIGTKNKCKYNQRKPVYLLLEGYTRYQQSRLWWNDEPCIDVRPFNIYVDWSRILINSDDTSTNQNYPKIIDKADSRVINLIIFGMSRFGRAIGIEALYSLPDLYEPGGKTIQSLITFVSEDAKRDLEVFKVYYKELFQQVGYKYYDYSKSKGVIEQNDDPIQLPYLSFEFINSSPFDSQLYSYLEQRSKEGKYKMSIYACTEKDAVDSNIGLFLPSLNCDIYVLQRYGTAYLEKLNLRKNKGNHLYPFGIIDSGYDWNIARDKDNSSIAEKMLESGEDAFDRGDYESALTNYDKSLEIRKMIVGENHPETAWNYFNIGIVYYKLRDFEQSLSNFMKALDIRKSIMGCQHPMVSHCYNSLGILYREMGRQSAQEIDRVHYFNISFIYLCRALIVRRESLGDMDKDTAASYNNLGNFYRSIGKYDKALAFLKKSLELRERLYEIHAVNQVKVVDSKHNIGRTYTKMGNIAEAKSLLLQAYSDYKEIFKERKNPHPYIGMCCNSLGELYEKDNDFNMALKYYQEALDIYVSEYAVKKPDHPFIQQAHNNIERVQKFTRKMTSS